MTNLDHALARLAAANVVAVLSGEGERILDANDRFLELTGFDRDELATGRISWRALTPAEWAPLDDNAVNEMLATGVCAAYRKEYARADGSRVPVRVVGVAASREPFRWVALVEDLRVEEAEEAATRARLLHAAPVGLFTTDAHGDVSFVNCRLSALTRQRAEDASGSGWYDVVHPDDREQVGRSWSAAVAARAPWRDVHRLRPREGTDIWVQAEADPVFDAEGVLTGYVGTVTDITDARAATAQLLHADKMESIGRLASGVAHDLTNALTAVRVNLTLVAKEVSSENGRQRMAMVEEAVAAASNVVSQLVRLARPDREELEPVDVAGLVDDVVKLASPALDHGVEVSLVEPCCHLSSVVNPSRLQHAVLNLLVNARDAIEDRGSITVATGHTMLSGTETTTRPPLPAGEYATITVTDTGSGMDEPTLDRLFEPFFTTKGDRGGTGLGLVSTYSIVTGVGGGLAVDSEPGRGTQFTVYLPIDRTPAHQ